MLNKLYLKKNIIKNLKQYIHLALIFIISIVVVNILSIYMDSLIYGDKLKYSEYLNISAVSVEQIFLFNILKFVFTTLATISIYFIYTIFIVDKKKDLGILMSLGIKKKQLLRLLFFELFAVYICSFFIAMAISNITMFILIQKFLSVKNENLIYIVYKFSIPSSIFAFVLSLFSLIIAFTITAQKILNIPIIETINKPVNININRNVNIWNKSSAIKYLIKANLFRNKKHFIISSLLSIPTICICILFFNYTNLLNLPQNESDFTIYNIDSGEYKQSETVLKSIEELKNVYEIENITYSIYYNNYLMKLDTAKLKFPVYITIDGVNYSHISIKVISNTNIEKYRENSRGNIDNYNLENYILLSKNIPSSKYSEGDQIFIEIYRHNHEDSKNSYEPHDEIDMKTLTIAGFINSIQYADDFLDIFVTEENFEKITGYPPIPNLIHINIKNGTDIEIMEERLYSIFGNNELFQIINNIGDISKKQAEDQFIKGIIILITFLCMVLFICIIILLWVFISYYVYAQKPQITILNILGAYRKTITKISVYEAAIKGVANSAAGIVLGTWISYMVINMAKYNILINIYSFIVYGVIIIITILAHILPSFITVKKITFENEKVGGKK